MTELLSQVFNAPSGAKFELVLPKIEIDSKKAERLFYLKYKQLANIPYTEKELDEVTKLYDEMSPILKVSNKKETIEIAIKRTDVSGIKKFTDAMMSFLFTYAQSNVDQVTMDLDVDTLVDPAKKNEIIRDIQVKQDELIKKEQEQIKEKV